MKKFKLIACLFACFAMATAVVSCDKDDSPNTENNGGENNGGDNTGDDNNGDDNTGDDNNGTQTPEVKLLTQVNYGENPLFTAIYNEDNKLEQLIGIIDIIQVYYDPMEVRIFYLDVDDNDDPYIYAESLWTNIQLNGDGFITSSDCTDTEYSSTGEVIDNYTYSQTFNYTEGYLTQNTYILSEEGEEDYEYSVNYQWNDGLLIGVGDVYDGYSTEYYKLSYNNAQKNLNNQWIPVWLNTDAHMFMTYLLGNAPVQLPTNETINYGEGMENVSFAYNLDSSGYVTSLNWGGQLQLSLAYMDVRSFTPLTPSHALKDIKPVKSPHRLFRPTRRNK